MTLEDGSSVDSRQLIEGDDLSNFMQATLSDSWLWWNTTASVVLPTLEAAGPDAFALVIGGHSIADTRQDGTTRRTGLRGLLPGGSGIMQLVTARDEDPLPGGFEQAAVLTHWTSGERIGSVGVRRVGQSGNRWWFLRGSDSYMHRIG